MLAWRVACGVLGCNSSLCSNICPRRVWCFLFFCSFLLAFGLAVVARLCAWSAFVFAVSPLRMSSRFIAGRSVCVR